MQRPPRDHTRRPPGVEKAKVLRFGGSRNQKSGTAWVRKSKSPVLGSGPRKNHKHKETKRLGKKTKMLDNFCFFTKNLQNHKKIDKKLRKPTKRERVGAPWAPRGPHLSLLVGFLLVCVDFLMIFQVFGKKNQKLSSILGFF